MKTSPYEELMAPLFEKANREKLWFYSLYAERWFSPRQLKEQHEQGNFCWGPTNWELASPMVELERLNKQIQELIEEKIAIHKEIEANQ